MGLAASQARFLGITARKNACELRTMEIAQERLSVSNQLSQASQNYMNSLNATRLIWNPEITDDYIYNLDYASMTRPSYFNDYQLQFLTNPKGKAVLDSSFYNALANITFDSKSGGSGVFANFTDGNIARTPANFNKFIDALVDVGIISHEQKVRIDAALQYSADHPTSAAVYDPYNGFGHNMSHVAEIYSTDLVGLCEYIDEVTTDIGNSNPFLEELLQEYGSNPMCPTPYDNAYNVIQMLNFSVFKTYTSNLDGVGIISHIGNDNYNPEHSDESISDLIHGNNTQNLNSANINYDTDSYDNFNFSDLIGDLDLALIAHTDGSNDGINACVGLIDIFVENLANIARNFFEFDNNQDEKALQNTLRIISNLYKDVGGNLRTTDAEYTDTNGVITGGIMDYDKYCIPVMQGNSVVFSLANLTQAFFTEYENQRSKGTTGYFIEPLTGLISDSHLITMNGGYMYDYVDVGTPPPSDDISQIINYYSQMFNQICVKGFVYNSAVDDSNNLQNMLKNGYLAVNTIGDDGYFYQFDYMAFTKGHGYFKEVADEDAIALAEAEYKVKQAQLNAKEEELSVDMQTVEAELAALSTEYDTVKNLISKSVQKDFSTCSGG